MKQSHVVNDQGALGELLDMLNIASEVDTHSHDTRHIAKHNFEPFFAHFRSVEKARRKHKEVRGMQIIIICNIGCNGNIHGRPYCSTALTDFAKRRRGRVAMPKTADVLEDSKICCCGGVGLDF